MVYSPGSEEFLDRSSESYDAQWIESLATGVDPSTGAQAQSIAELIGRLPADLRRSFALLIDSTSAQAATRTEPSIVLVNANASFLLRFTSETAQRGSQTIEMIRYVSENREFVPYQLSFETDPASGERRWNLEARPERCYRCHGKVFRPIWASYPIWPKFLGAVHAGPWPNGLAKQFHDVEAEILAKFQEASGTDPRYQQLGSLSTASVGSLVDMNTAITTHLNHLNAQRVSKILRSLLAQKPEAARALREVLAKLALGRGPTELRPLLPSEDQARYDTEFGTVFEDMRQRLDRIYPELIQAHLKALGIETPAGFDLWTNPMGLSIHDLNFFGFQTPEQNRSKTEETRILLAQLRFVIENVLGGDLSALSLSESRDPYHLTITDGAKRLWNYLRL